jgi:hypothetical protein
MRFHYAGDDAMGIQGRPHRDRALSGHTKEQNARSQEDRSEEHNSRSVGCLTAVLSYVMAVA